MTDVTTRERVSQRVPLWRDVIVLKWVTQVFLLLVVLSAMWFLANQAGDNLRARNINTDFDFLERPSTFRSVRESTPTPTRVDGPSGPPWSTPCVCPFPAFSLPRSWA